MADSEDATLGRLGGSDLLRRIEDLCDRVLDVVQALELKGISRRITDQLTGSGTAVGANVFEADEALRVKDFRKCLAIAVKELNETRFWIRLIARRDWLPSERLAGLLDECDQIRRILGSILQRTDPARQQSPA